MHQLERETYDDAFLDEALEGYEELPDDDHEETFARLKSQLHQRAAKSKQRSLLLWRVLPIAASVLIMLGVGYWFLKPEPIKDQKIQTKLTDNKRQIPVNKSVPPKINPKERKLLTDADVEPKQTKASDPVLREVSITGTPSIKYKTDTVEYIASDYKVRENAGVDEILKKAEGFKVDTNGNIAYNGQAVTKARLNGKEYTGGDLNTATRNLPADIIDKIQVVDDYGDQANMTGIKTREPNKILNLTTRKRTSVSGKVLMNEGIFYTPQVIYKTDTIEYITNNYPISNAAKVLNVIRNAPGFELEGGVLYYQAKQIRKIKVNDKEYPGKDLLDVTRNLPADILEEIQIIDDYADAALITRIKSGDPLKIINLVVRDIKNRRLPWAIEMNGVIIPGDTSSKPKPIIGWKKYADYIRRNIKTAANSKKEMMVFFYVAPDGTLSNINVIGYDAGVNATDIVKNGPKWVGFTAPRQIWFKVKL